MNSAKGKNTVLVFGDWVVDEYWFLVRHNSETSSHTGFVHYRVSSGSEDVVVDLCGAGHVARLFHHLRTSEKKDFDIVGVGRWNIGDEDQIAHLIHARDEGSKCIAANPNFRIIPDNCHGDTNITLRTLMPNGQSARVIRTYHEGRNGLEQIDRIDWELDKNSPATKSNPVELNQIDLPENISTVVIYDLHKGVVTSESIKQLYRLYPNADWFVRSKETKPDWIEDIKKSLKLLLIGPEVASSKNPWECWLLNNRISLTGINILSELSEKNTILLSDRRDLLARINNKDCITGKSYQKPTPITQLGWASAFFAAIIYKMNLDRQSPARDIHPDDIRYALELADKHAGVPTFRNQLDEISSHYQKPSIGREDWASEVSLWRQATSDTGLIEDQEGKLRLEVWRGSTQIPGYVACVDKKKEILDEIGQNIRAFMGNNSIKKRSLSILLQADPGSGKTYLAKSLASVFDLNFLSFDITQMVHREELLDLFDTVATRQVNSNTPLLIFVDEINATLQGNQVYGSFLSPLEDGIYIRNGNAFSLEPCIWVFAGTKIDGDHIPSSEKLSDYKSRMSMIRRIDFQALRDGSKDKGIMESQAKLEQVYIGALMTKKYYSDVKEISWDVLEKFYQENPLDAPARSIAKKVSLLKNVQYGRITPENCDLWERVSWTKERTNVMVKLLF